MNNTFKYADCNNIYYSLSTNGSKCALRYKTMGSGFIAAEKNSGNGLRNMQARADEIGARFNIQSQPGAGTIISCRSIIPSFGGVLNLNASIYICTVNETQVIRVAIFEDNPIMMDAYRSILNGSPGYRCTGSFTSCNNWKHDIEQSKPDVVLMDIEMTGVNGIKATSLIKREFPHIKILIQTVFEDDSKILESICAGANGYILKNTFACKNARSSKRCTKWRSGF
jgi:CheY-like chemotaxis protein